MDSFQLIAEGEKALNALDFQTARRFFQQAYDADPTNFWAEFWTAMTFSREGRYPEAVAAFEALIQRSPTNHTFHNGLAISHIDAAHFPEAEEALTRALEQAGFDYWLGFNYAHVAERLHRYADAEKRWARFLEDYPDDVFGRARRARALIYLHRLDEAEAELARLDAASEDLQVQYSRAMLTSAKGEDQAALAQWRALRAAHPQNNEIQDAWGRAETKAQFAVKENADATDTDAEDHVLLRYAGMGCDCEFGLVQRHFGLEPLGLLRWALVEPEHLAILLDEGISAIGDPSLTHLSNQMNMGVYYVELPSYHLKFNTMVYIHTVDEDEFLKVQNKRTKFLARQFVDQMETGEKIFVFKQNNPIRREAAEALWKSLQKYGPNKLLYVAEPEDPSRHGSIEVVNPLFMYGYLNELGGRPGIGWRIPHDDWLALCAQAADRFDAMAAGG